MILGSFFKSIGEKAFERVAIVKTAEHNRRYNARFDAITRLSDLLTKYHRIAKALIDNLGGPDEKKHYQIEAAAKDEIVDFLNANAFCLPADFVKEARTLLSKYPEMYSLQRSSWRRGSNQRTDPEVLIKIDNDIVKLGDEIEFLRAGFTDRCRQLVGVETNDLPTLQPTNEAK